MFYTEEELLEAVDILVEDYGIDEDYAIELVSEAYNEELLEAVDILVEDYGFDEDYAIELVSEAYNEELLAEGKFNPIKNIKDTYVDAYQAGKNVYNTRKKYKDEETKHLINDLQVTNMVNNKDSKATDEEIADAKARRLASYDATNQAYNSYKTAKDNALKPIGKAAGYTAIGAGAATAGALVARKAIKHHKAKKEAEARRRRSLRGRLSGRC